MRVCFRECVTTFFVGGNHCCFCFCSYCLLLLPRAFFALVLKGGGKSCFHTFSFTLIIIIPSYTSSLSFAHTQCRFSFLTLALTSTDCVSTPFPTTRKSSLPPHFPTCTTPDPTPLSPCSHCRSCFCASSIFSTGRWHYSLRLLLLFGSLLEVLQDLPHLHV